tara:strand:- start:63 stop:710 length:648 start_codon:yes stop_codon:yes gene_type:complete
LVIVENKKDWEKFMIEFEENNSIVIPIQCDENKHPMDTKLCLLYIKLLDGELEEYILPFRHSDAINLESKYITKTWTPKDVFTYDKKKLLHFVKWENVYDVQMNYYMNTNEPLMIDEVMTNAHEHFYRIYYKTPDINCVIPLMKHIEWCRQLVERLKVGVLGTKEVEAVCNVYNKEVIEGLQYIEQSGLQTVNGMVLVSTILIHLLVVHQIDLVV